MKYFGCNRSLSVYKAFSYIRAVAAVNAPAQPLAVRIADQKSAYTATTPKQRGAAGSLNPRLLCNFIVITKFQSKVNISFAIPPDWCLQILDSGAMHR
jgi:hypothetical protein